MHYKSYDVEVSVSSDESGASAETTYAIYRGNRRIFTGITTPDAASVENNERAAYAAARRWIDEQSNKEKISSDDIWRP